MNTKKIETLVYDAYCQDGVQAACTEADKHSCTKYEYCNACEAQMPTIKGDHICIVCGQETTTRNPDTEDIPCENDENN